MILKMKPKTYDPNLLQKNIEINTPTEIYLNFFEQLDINYEKTQGIYTGKGDLIIDKYRREYLNWLEEELQTPITMLGTGPDLKDYIDSLEKENLVDIIE